MVTLAISVMSFREERDANLYYLRVQNHPEVHGKVPKNNKQQKPKTNKQTTKTKPNKTLTFSKRAGK